MLAHLYRALTTPHGIVLSTDDPTALIAKLNKARREAEDPTLTVLHIGRSRDNPETEVWIIKDAPQERQTPEAG